MFGDRTPVTRSSKVRQQVLHTQQNINVGRYRLLAASEPLLLAWLCEEPPHAPTLVTKTCGCREFGAVCDLCCVVSRVPRTLVHRTLATSGLGVTFSIGLEAPYLLNGKTRSHPC